MPASGVGGGVPVSVGVTTSSFIGASAFIVPSLPLSVAIGLDVSSPPQPTATTAEDATPPASVPMTIRIFRVLVTAIPLRKK
jgi:hypothetical protein